METKKQENVIVKCCQQEEKTMSISCDVCLPVYVEVSDPGFI